MKVKIEFDLEDYSDIKAHRRCINSTAAYMALSRIAEELFRPNRKHGYDREIEDLFDALGDDAEIATEIIDKLEERFYSLLEELRVDLDDLE